MLTAVPLACFLSVIRPPGVQFEKALLQVAPVDKSKCPLLRDTNDVEFQLFTRYNPTVYQELVIGDDDKLLASNINFHDPTVIYFHAFMEMPDESSALLVREAYMLQGKSNVIMVDASRLEAGPWYFTAADNTWYIGRFAAKFIDYLVSRGLDLSKTHLIGHSLGGQSAGVAGGSLTTGRVSRITGLDPALPLFANLPLEQRLDPSDAHFVDVIHTDAGIFGVKTPTGHADFYPNGGMSPQPGCELEVVLSQHLLLNKCDRHTKPQGYYKFDLKPKKHGKKRSKTHKHRKTHVNRHFDTTLETTKREDTFHDITRQDMAPYKTITKKTIPLHIIKTVKNINTKRIMISENTDTKPTIDSDSRHLIKNTKPNDSTFHAKRTDTSAPIKSRKPDTFHAIKPYSLDKLSKQTNADEDLSQDTQPSKLDSFNSIKTLLDVYPDTTAKAETSHVKKRQKRFLPFFKKSETAESDNFFFKILEFVNKNRRNVIPVFTVMREINTLVKSANGELNHSSKERNNFIGHNPPIFPLATYNLELGSDSKAKAFVKRLLGLKVEGDRLTIAGK